MKKIMSVILVLAMILAFAACGNAGQGGNTAQTQDSGEFISPDGWSVKYDPQMFEAFEIDGGARFEYIEKTQGECMIAITYEDGKQPNEVLSEHASDWDESQVRLEGYLVGTEDKWAYTRILNTKAEDGHDLIHQLTAGEYGSGVILFDILMHLGDDDAHDMAVSDGISDIMDSIKYGSFPPQTELSYVPGTYIQEFTEEYEGQEVQLTVYIALNEDHTGLISIQDEIDVLWSSNELIPVTGGPSYQYTVEGDKLYVDLNTGEWEEFTRTDKEFTRMQ